MNNPGNITRYTMKPFVKEMRDLMEKYNVTISTIKTIGYYDDGTKINETNYIFSDKGYPMNFVSIESIFDDINQGKE